MGLIVNFSDFENISASNLGLSDYLVGFASDPDRETRISIGELVSFLESVSTNDLFTVLNLNSASWNSVYSTVKSLSDDWEESQFISPLQIASAGWNSTYTTTNVNSAFWNDVYNNVAITSAARDSVYSTVQSLSDSWEESAIISPLQSASASWNSVYSSFNSSSASIIIDGGNLRYNSDPTLIVGANSDQHLRFRSGGSTNDEIRMTILSSGEVGIKTTLAQTKAQQVTPLANGDFSNTTGMAFNSFDWYGGTIPSWTKPADGVYDVYFTVGTYTANLFGGPTGPGTSSCRQSIGVIPQLTDIAVNFTNRFLFGTPSTSLTAAIYTSTYTVLASGSYNSLGNHTLTAPNVPAGTSVIVAFWGESGLANVSLSANNDTIFTTLGSISSNSVLISSKIQINDGVVILKNLPTSSTGLPAGTVWNNSGVLNIV